MDHILRPTRFEGQPGTTADTWKHWHRTLTNCLAALTAAHPDNPPDKLSILINYISPNVYSLISECTEYNEAIKILENTYIKPVNTIFARHLLATKKQGTETIDQFVQTLQQLAKDCKFTAVTAPEHADQAIRDAFITGLTSQSIRQRLLENTELTLEQAVSTARSLESAQTQANMYHPITPLSAAAAVEKEIEDHHCAAINKPAKTTSQGQSIKDKKCYFCGKPYHNRRICPARESLCLNCGKKGHYAVVCRSSGSTGSSKQQTSAATIAMATDKNSAKLPSSMVEINVNQSEIRALIDSGSTTNFIRPEVAYNLQLNILPSQEAISMASSPLLSHTKGHCFSTITINGQEYRDVRLSLLPNLCAPVILGQEFMKLHKSVEFRYEGELPVLEVCGSAQMKVTPPSLFTNLTSDCRPTRIPTRKYSPSDQAFIRNETKRLLQQGIIRKSHTPWRAQVLVTTNERHKRRMVIDYSSTINRFTQLDAFPMPKISDIIQQLSKYTVFSKLDLESAYHQCPIREDETCYTGFEADGELYEFTRLPFGLTNSVAGFQRIMNDIIKDNNLKGTFAYIDDIVIGGKDQAGHDTNVQAFKEVANRLGIRLNPNKCVYNSKTLNYLGYLIENHNLRPDPERLTPLKTMPIPECSKSLKRALGLFSYYSPWVRNYSSQIAPLLVIKEFPLSAKAVQKFNELKKEICEACLAPIDDEAPFLIETDASGTSVAAVLSQKGRPVAFFSRTLSQSERSYSAVEREAAAIIESVRKWRQFILGRNFTIITDQQAATYMFNARLTNRIKNDKLLRWRLELSNYSYEIQYRPGTQNYSADALSRMCSATSQLSLKDTHIALCHPGITRLMHFVRQKNLPFSMEDVKRVCAECPICAEEKPRFYKPTPGRLVHATRPMERLSMDFMGPKPSTDNKKYLLVLVDECSRFPFVYPCEDMSTTTVVKCLQDLFYTFGCPDSIHADRGAQFMSNELRSFLWQQGIVITHSTPYHPTGNGQCERENGTIWRTIRLALRSQGLDDRHWQKVLGPALHAIRSLLCTATNSTPHEKMFGYPRRSKNGYSLPAWLQGGLALVRKFVRSKSDPLVESVDIITATPNFARIRYQDGRESTVSTCDLAPPPSSPKSLDENEETIDNPESPNNSDCTGPIMTSRREDTFANPAQPPTPIPSENAPDVPVPGHDDAARPAGNRSHTRFGRRIKPNPRYAN